ncbi:MAG: phosphoribosylformylglycinamidine synthase [Clostridiales Family XIII bacterium]|jgi:phosphoribosylformylglycinamidine synthase|nr:phosphoribosylformylglycinamidine synthase [Clostridiales Family XIII bacterium]
MIQRIYVEKRAGFDVEAQNLRAELTDILELDGLGAVRILNRYDIEGASHELFEAAISGILSEPNLDTVYLELPKPGENAFVFGVEYLPGQYDQRADSAAQCMGLLRAGAEGSGAGDAEDIRVRYAKILIIEGTLTEAQRLAVKKYCINPVDSREASLEMPDTLRMDLPDPAPVARVAGFRDMSSSRLDELHSEMGFAMSADDLAFVQAHYRDTEGREPTVTELRVIDTYWSDHCRHTTFLTKLSEIELEDGDYAKLIADAFGIYLAARADVYGDANDPAHPICLMDMATIGAKALKKHGVLDDLDESDEINACSIRVKARVRPYKDTDTSAETREEDWLVMFKNETHNHPTEIEPFGGAATCLGGAIRDPLSGRVYVYQAMRVTGAGDPTAPLKDTLPGKLPQFQITRGAARGYSSYGNQVGLATGLVDEIYDEGYRAKRMEIGAVIGAAPASHVRRARPAVGDVILLVGGRTGRDGLGGATGSSKSHTEESVATAGAEVQKGNPPPERAIQRLFRREEAARLIKKCNDFGAGGVSVAIGELADSIDVYLDNVPKKYEGLDGTELAIAESQERMAVVLVPEDADRFTSYAAEENIEATIVAKVTDTGRFRMTWRDDTVFDLPRSFLDTNGVRPERKVSVIGMKIPSDADFAPDGFTDAQPTEDDLLSLLGDLGCASRRGLIENFDSTIGRGSILMPLGGRNQLTPQHGMAAKLPVPGADTDTATFMAWDYDPRLSKISPYHGAILAVLGSAAKIAALGGDVSRIRLTFQEYFEKPGSVPERWGKPTAALLGALSAQLELGIAAIGGKDSMSGTFNDLDVPPTLVSFAVCVTDAQNVVSAELKGAGHHLVFVHTPKDENYLPDFGRFKAHMRKVYELAQTGRIHSANIVGNGGTFAALAKAAIGNDIGFRLENLSSEELVTPSPGSLLLELDADMDIHALFGDAGAQIIGVTTESDSIEITPEGVSAKPLRIPLSSVKSRFAAPLEKVFPTDIAAAAANSRDSGGVPVITCNERAGRAPAIKTAKPRVFIPVFPGTNCETDSKEAFERAGAKVLTVNLRNMTPDALSASIRETAAAIRESHIIMLPGGFSAGDEPEGSAKFIAAVFGNPLIADEVTNLLDNRDGLILGICNGFQALIKLGLVPYGKITPADAGAPTLTFNTIGRHVSRIVRTRVASVLSPWLAEADTGDVFLTPVSHGEGRFVCSPSVLADLQAGGQIATQYADADGLPTMDIDFNVNGSVLAIEGITSPDGRVFGKMGHIERTGPHLYKNVPGNYDTRIIESGVNYFT